MNGVTCIVSCEVEVQLVVQFAHDGPLKKEQKDLDGKVT